MIVGGATGPVGMDGVLMGLIAIRVRVGMFR